MQSPLVKKYGWKASWFSRAPPNACSCVALNTMSALCITVAPVALQYLSPEMQKFLGSIFFGWDLGMYDARSEQAAKANTSDLNEELGQVSRQSPRIRAESCRSDALVGPSSHYVK